MNKEVSGHRTRLAIIIVPPLTRETYSCSAFHTITRVARNRPCPTSRLSRIHSTSHPLEFNNISSHTYIDRIQRAWFFYILAKAYMVCDLTLHIRVARFSSLWNTDLPVNIPIPRELMVIYSPISKSYAFSIPPPRSRGMERIARNASSCHLRATLHVIQGKSHARKSAWVPLDLQW